MALSYGPNSIKRPIPLHLNICSLYYVYLAQSYRFWRIHKRRPKFDREHKQHKMSGNFSSGLFACFRRQIWRLLSLAIFIKSKKSQAKATRERVASRGAACRSLLARMPRQLARMRRFGRCPRGRQSPIPCCAPRFARRMVLLWSFLRPTLTIYRNWGTLCCWSTYSLLLSMLRRFPRLFIVIA